jgi:hypothetical protein
MLRTVITSLPLLALLTATPALAKEPDPMLPAETLKDRPEARIAFASSSGIQNFVARREASEDILYVEGLGRTWYRARFLGPCRDIQFANALGFETRATNSLDRFSAILVRRPGGGHPDRCTLTSLVKLTTEEAVTLRLRSKPVEKASATPATAPAPQN